jgi:thymidylate synthase (FAD)
MKIIKPLVTVDSSELCTSKLKNIERAARICYKSENKMTDEIPINFIKNILINGHESVIEHEKITVIFVVDRGVTHELVRHRIASYSQESTRYCNYVLDKFGGEITVIEPFFYEKGGENFAIWKKACEYAESCYMELIKSSTPQEARSVLPNSLKTEIVVTFNMREWRHFFKLRCDIRAHPQMRQVAIPLLLEFRERLSPLFDDIVYDEKFPREHYAEIRVE